MIWLTADTCCPQEQKVIQFRVANIEPKLACSVLRKHVSTYSFLRTPHPLAEPE